MVTPRVLLILALIGSSAAAADSVYLTVEGTPKGLNPAAPLVWREDQTVNEKREGIFLDSTKRFQSLIGIGGAITDAAAETLAKLPAAQQEEVVRAYYDRDQGIGYSLARTNIHSCDFSSDSYTYIQDGDASLATFTVAHDEKYRLPLLRRAIAAAGGKLTLFASPWSPPAWMKENGSMLHGGKLKPEYREVWARYSAAFVKAYRAAGVPVWALTVQNEPMAVQKWESCFFTAEEERDFVKDYLGPVLAKSGLSDVKIIAWDHNRTLLYQRAQTLLDDPAAAKYIWGIGYHWYLDDCFENVRLVKSAYPAQHLLLTEACNYPYTAEHRGDWAWGEKYGNALINDFNAGAEGWTDWNILLDETGGPNHVGNFCFAPIHGDTRTGALFYQNSYYYLGHFSKFIRPGARRVAASSTTNALQTTAFLNADGKLAAVVMNPTDKPVNFTFWRAGRSAERVSPAHSILTAVIE